MIITLKSIPKETLNTKHICWKDQESFFGFRFQKFCLVNQNLLYFTGGIKREKSSIQDAVFIPKMNTYFFCTKEFLFQKNIDYTPPKIVMEIDSDLDSYTSLLYIKKKHRLVINCGDRVILFNLATSKIEAVIEQPEYFDEHDRFLRLLALESGPLRLILLSSEGIIVLIKVSERCAQDVIQHLRKNSLDLCDLDDDVFDQNLVQMGICPNEKYLILGKSSPRNPPTNFTIFEIGADSLSRRQSLYVPAQEAKLHTFRSPFSSIYFGDNHLIFKKTMKRYAIELDGQWRVSPNDSFSVIDYNLRTGELSFTQPDLGEVVCFCRKG